jgi:hypothetical protein
MDELSLTLIGAILGLFILYLYGMNEKLSDIKAELAEIRRLFEFSEQNTEHRKFKKGRN